MRNTLTVPIIAAVLSATLVSFFILHNSGTQNQTAHEDAYDRVMRTGVLHCAYGLWEPSIIREPPTGQFSGIIYDFM